MAGQNIQVMGIDLDNTIINYDDLMHQISVELKLIPPGFSKEKLQIRDHIRKTSSDLEWQKVQGMVYGPRIGEARLNTGVYDFILNCKKHSIPTYIVSHKTEYAGVDPTKTNLRTAAMEFLGSQGFFDSKKLGLDPSKNIFFEATRANKVTTIGRLGCSWFVDDLEETFLEPWYPRHVNGILYSQENHWKGDFDVKIIPTWKEINEFFFG